MREVLVLAKCDKCLTEIEATDEPLPKWVIGGNTYRPELCDKCVEEVLSMLKFMSPVTKKKIVAHHPKKKSRTGGKFAKVDTPCPACERVFSTPSGVSQHMSQLVKKGDRAHKKYIREGGEV